MVEKLDFGWAARCSLVLEWLLVAVVLWARRPSPSAPTPIGAVRLAAAGVAVFLAFLLKIFLWRGLDPFGVVHLMYLDAVVLAPSVAAALLLADWRSRRRFGRPFVEPIWRLPLAIVLGLAPLGLWASLAEPRRLVTEKAALRVSTGERVPLSAGGQLTRTLTIGVLADLQTDRVAAHERQAVERLLRLRPDLVLLPGDLFQGSGSQFETQLPALRALLAQITAPGGVYAVRGNVDGHGRLERAVVGTQVRLLKNELVETAVNGWHVSLVGVDEPWQSGTSYRAALQRLIPELPPPAANRSRILLAHRPDVVLALAEDEGARAGVVPASRRAFDLVVAGHTHGGQVQLPVVGPLITLSAVPRPVAAGGLHWLNGYPLYVSRGVGIERGQAPPVRFLCPPAVDVIYLSAGSE